MRNGQNKRMRGRNRKGGHHQNPLSRMYESNGPDVKIRGTASHVAEKYLQLARDAQSSGDPIAAENYYQHAEHYFRLIAAAQEQFRQSQPYYQQQGERARQSSRRRLRRRRQRAAFDRRRTVCAARAAAVLSARAAAPANAAAAPAVPRASTPAATRGGRRTAAVLHHRRTGASAAAATGARRRLTVRMAQTARMARMALTDRPTAFRCTGGVAATAGRAISRSPARAMPRILPAGRTTTEPRLSGASEPLPPASAREAEGGRRR